MTPLHSLLKLYRFAIYCICLLLFCAPSSNSQAQENIDGDFIKGVPGSAPIYDNNTEAAISAAVRVALNRALEQKVGVHLQSDRLTVDATMLTHIIRAHSQGYAKFMGHAKPPRRDGDMMKVLINVQVSKRAPKDILKKLKDPKGILVYISETIISDRRADRSDSPMIENELQAQLQHLLASEDKGYKVWLLLDNGERVQKAIEGYASSSIQALFDPRSKSIIEEIGLRELADVFVVGEMSIKLRDSDIPGAVVADTVTRLKLLRIDSSTNRIEVYTLPSLMERGIHRHVDRAFAYAVSDTTESAQPLIEQLEKWTGAPNRLVVLYVEGLPSLFIYKDLQDQLRQYAALGVESVRGAIFAEDVSKIVLTLSEQSLLETDIDQQVEYLAAAVDEKRDYEVKGKGRRTIFFRYVGN
jgi:hypothetical protein